MFKAVRGGDEQKNLDVVKLLLDHGADVNYETEEPTYKNASPLAIAVHMEHTNQLNLLIERGADFRRTFGGDFCGEEAESYLHLACVSGYLDGVVTLMCAGLEAKKPTYLEAAMSAPKNEYEITR